ncbi:LUD domain-containing protein [Escherichia coli]
MTQNGGHVSFAKTKEDATRYILQVAQRKNARKVVKSKSMVTEEIGVNHVLQDAGIQVIETDLGKYVSSWIKIRPLMLWSRQFIRSPSDPSSATRTSGL